MTFSQAYQPISKSPANWPAELPDRLVAGVAEGTAFRFEGRYAYNVRAVQSLHLHDRREVSSRPDLCVHDMNRGSVQRADVEPSTLRSMIQFVQTALSGDAIAE